MLDGGIYFRTEASYSPIAWSVVNVLHGKRFKKIVDYFRVWPEINLGSLLLIADQGSELWEAALFVHMGTKRIGERLMFELG